MKLQGRFRKMLRGNYKRLLLQSAKEMRSEARAQEQAYHNYIYSISSDPYIYPECWPLDWDDDCDTTLF